MNIQNFQKAKQEKNPITFVTCYDYFSAKIAQTSNVDCVLVGDSVAMVVHGYPNTLAATTQMMVTHTQAVAKGITTKLIVSDLPFLAHRKSWDAAFDAIEQVMRAGAHAIKLEGAKGNLELIHHIVESGVPVMGHIGLTPQSVHALSGHKVQGYEKALAEDLCMQARDLEQAGVFGLVLECVPWALAQRITKQLKIPTIGIGAGPYTDGQVLVWHDLLGIQNEFKPKFLKTYLEGFTLAQQALNQYVTEVQAATFPTLEQHSFGDISHAHYPHLDTVE